MVSDAAPGVLCLEVSYKNNSIFAINLTNPME
jgi:hypothetical protein